MKIKRFSILIKALGGLCSYIKKKLVGALGVHILHLHFLYFNSLKSIKVPFCGTSYLPHKLKLKSSNLISLSFYVHKVFFSIGLCRLITLSYALEGTIKQVQILYAWVSFTHVLKQCNLKFSVRDWIPF